MYKSTGEQDSSEPINDDHINIVNYLDLEITSEAILNAVLTLIDPPYSTLATVQDCRLSGVISRYNVLL